MVLSMIRTIWPCNKHGQVKLAQDFFTVKLPDKWPIGRDVCIVIEAARTKPSQTGSLTRLWAGAVDTATDGMINFRDRARTPIEKWCQVKTNVSN